jgi:pyruvate/2-oxoglutarate dehydrogenase complex dihydrolipoamide acyltransferase (E2) component
MADERIQRVTMPKWGLSMKTGKIVEWFVAEGDTIAKGDDVVDIETDKIAGTLESPVGGLIRRIIAEPGADLPVGAVLAVVAPSEVATSTSTPSSRRRRPRSRPGPSKRTRVRSRSSSRWAANDLLPDLGGGR